MQVGWEAVRPDGPGSSKEEEYRLSVALLPLRLRIDQNMVTFLQGFFTPSDPDKGAKENKGSEEVASSSSAAQEAEGESRTVSFQLLFIDYILIQCGSCRQILYVQVKLHRCSKCPILVFWFNP